MLYELTIFLILLFRVIPIFVGTPLINLQSEFLIYFLKNSLSRNILTLASALTFEINLVLGSMAKNQTFKYE